MIPITPPRQSRVCCIRFSLSFPSLTPLPSGEDYEKSLAEPQPTIPDPVGQWRVLEQESPICMLCSAKKPCYESIILDIICIILFVRDALLLQWLSSCQSAVLPLSALLLALYFPHLSPCPRPRPCPRPPLTQIDCGGDLMATLNPDFIRTQGACNNLHDMCKTWAEAGECKNNPG